MGGVLEVMLMFRVGYWGNKGVEYVVGVGGWFVYFCRVFRSE